MASCPEPVVPWGSENLRRGIRQTSTGRSAAGDDRDGAPAHPEDHRSRGVLVRRHLLHRVRDRGDPLRRRGRGFEPCARAEHADPDRDRGRHPADDRHHVVPPDDLRVPERRRQLRRQSREPRREPFARRGRVTARRLHPHRGGVDLCRRRRHRVDPRVPGSREAPRRARPGPDPRHQPRQPARHQGVGPHLRGAHVHLHRGARRARELRAVPQLRARRHPPHQPVAVRRRGQQHLRRHARHLHPVEGLLVGCGRAHRGGGHLQRGARVPASGVEERRRDAGVDGRHPRHRCSWACRSWPTTSARTRASTPP